MQGADVLIIPRCLIFFCPKEDEAGAGGGGGRRKKKLLSPVHRGSLCLGERILSDLNASLIWFFKDHKQEYQNVFPRAKEEFTPRILIGLSLVSSVWSRP